ncbi:MAG: serine/threonine protein kinase, partial [Gemmatimonadetes bacterium]|nr:serine/threonine protein kinase [Gemmatimonadota bacterium]
MTADDAPSLESADLARRLQAALGEGFVVERELGAGGFAVVFLVRELALKRPLAIKVVSPDLITSHTVLARFRREAETVAGLSHPNIVPLHFIGEKDGLLYLAMGFVDGGDLAGRMEQAPGQQLSIREARRAIREVASALAHAHKRGVVHRDIKPSNILITPAGKAKLVDMGLARSTEKQPDGSLTQSGTTLGTFDYISPEQALEPRDADLRSDIYSLGCTLYHLLTGVPPVPEGTAAKKLHHHQQIDPIDPRQFNSDIPDEVAVVLARMMAKDRAARYQTAESLLTDLQSLLGKYGSSPSDTKQVLHLQSLPFE